MHKPRSRERRQRHPMGEANSENRNGESAMQQNDDNWHLEPSSSRQSAEPAYNPRQQGIKIPMKKLQDFQIRNAVGNITEEQKKAMLTEIPWDTLPKVPRSTLPSFNELHPEQQGNENVGHRPRPFDPERNEDGSAKLIPWRGCARARVWIKKPYNKKFWRYDTEHVRRRTLLESYLQDLKKMNREPSSFEVQQLENYRKKAEQAAAVLWEEGQKTLAKMLEEEAEMERQKERKEEIEKKKFIYSLLSSSKLYDVKEAMKQNFEEFLILLKHTKQNSSNNTANLFKEFRMQRATESYTLERPLAAPPMQMRIKSSNVVISHEVVGLSTTEEVDWDAIWFTDDRQEFEEEQDPEEENESVVGEQPSEANTSPRDDFLRPDEDEDSRQEMIIPRETEAEHFAKLTFMGKFEYLTKKHNKSGQAPPMIRRCGPASINRKLLMKERQEKLAKLAKQPFITRNANVEQSSTVDRQSAYRSTQRQRRTNTPVADGQTRETSPAVVNQIETPKKKNYKMDEKPVYVPEHHWEAILHEKEKKELEANGQQEELRPHIPAIIPNMGQQEYVRNYAAMINYQAEMSAIPPYGMEMREHPYGTDSQATSPAIMEEEITNEFIGELMNEIAAETMDEELATGQAEAIGTEIFEGDQEAETETIPAIDETMNQEVEPESVEEPQEQPVQAAEPVEEPADEPSETFMEEFVEIFSPPRERSPMLSPRSATPPPSPTAPSSTVAIPAVSQPPAPVHTPRTMAAQIPAPLPPIDTNLNHPKKFLVRDPITQQLIPSSGAVIIRNSPPGSATATSPIVREPNSSKVTVEEAPKKTRRPILSPVKSSPSQTTSHQLQPNQDEIRRKSNAGKVTKRIDPQDIPKGTIKKRGRPTKAESALRAALRAGLTPTGEMIPAQETSMATPVSSSCLPVKKRQLGEVEGPSEGLREPPAKARNVEEAGRRGDVPPASSSSTTSDSDPPKKISRRQRIREKQEAVRQEARQEEARKLAVEKQANFIAANIMREARQRESRESTVSGNNSQQVSPRPVEVQPVNQEPSPEVERSFREISIPVESTVFGKIYTSPQSLIPLDSRFATDPTTAHPKSRTRRQATIRQSQEAAQRKATSSPTSTANPAPSPDVIQLDGPSRESSIAIEDIGSESSSIHLPPKKRFLQRAQTIQQKEQPPSEPAPDVQLLSPPVREQPSDDDDIMIIEQVEKDPADIKRETYDALEQASTPVQVVTDKEYDEDGEDEPPLGFPLIYAYDFMEIDREEITADMIPFPPEAARVDGACFTHLLYSILKKDMRSHLPRLTNRYAQYPQDLLSFFESVSPRYLDENKLKLALEDPAQLVNIALSNLSGDAIHVLTTEQDKAKRKKQLVTSLKIRGIMTLFLQSRTDLLQELAMTVYGTTDGPQYEKLKKQFDASMNNIQISICDNLMGLAEETKDPKWKPTENVLKRRFEAFYFGWRGFILRGGPLKCFSNMFQNNGMANEINSTLEIWFQRLHVLLAAISHELIKEPVVRASELVRTFETNKHRSIQWDPALVDVRGEPSDEHQFGCEECKVYFTNKKYLEEHEDLHEYKPYECGVDYLGFSHQVSLYLHYLHRHLKDILSGELTVSPVPEYP